MQIIKPLFTTLLLSLFSIILYGQEFEGYIEYKAEPTFQFSGLLDKHVWDSMMVDMLGPDKSFLIKYYYQTGKYKSEIETIHESGVELYNDVDKLVYAWSLNSETALTKKSTETIDAFISLSENEGIDTILGIPCKSITIKTLFGTSTIWYNSSYFQINASNFETHTYGSLQHIFKHINCLPLKIETVGREGPIIQTAIAYKQYKIPDSLFTLPDFKIIEANPIN